MIEANPFETLRHQQEVKRERAHYLIGLAQQWTGPIQAGLRHLGQALWANRRVLGLIPIQDYRVRHRLEPEAYLWWVEHDIVPYDRYRCAAYRVQLTLDNQNDPVLTIQSGAAVYSVTPLTMAILDIVLAQAGQDPPLVIVREMGNAVD